MKAIRSDLTSRQRAMEVHHTIDPGFVHHRLIETVLGQAGVEEINRLISKLPDTPEWLKTTQINHIYTRTLLAFCNAVGVPTLSEILINGKGRLFCSTEEIEKVEEVYEARRIRTRLIPKGEYDYEVEIEFGTEHICSDTLKTELNEGNTLSIIAVNPVLNGSTLTFKPIVIGSPWLETRDAEWKDKIVWWGYEFFEHFIEDIDEFKKCRNTPTPSRDEAQIMERISENAFKNCLIKILGDSLTKDWGGETSDHFTSHIHLSGKRMNAAFLLKGPARFAPMTLNHLGKNNDQILRLSKEPAELLIVQHCHDITPAVRDTLRVFAVQPSNSRRYMLVDGRDSLRLLQAYDLVDYAISIS